MKKWSFASKTECTHDDRALEQSINNRLGRGSGSVACYRDSSGFGLVYSFNGLTKEFRRERLEVDVERLLKGLELTRSGMMNARLPAGWVDDPDDADYDPTWD